MKEVWVSVIGYEDIYEVSNQGRVRTKEGKTTQSVLHGTRHWKQRILQQKDTWAKHHTVWCGTRVTLWKDKQGKDYLVHRLEACSFYGIPLDTELTVNHRDGDRRNNSLQNLELISREDNIRHGYETGLYKNAMTPVTLEDGTGNVLEFESVRQMAKAIGVTGKSYLGCHTITGQNGVIYKVLKYG